MKSPQSKTSRQAGRAPPANPANGKAAQNWGMWPHPAAGWLAATRKLQHDTKEVLHVGCDSKSVDGFFSSLKNRNHQVIAPQASGILSIEESAVAHEVTLLILPHALAALHVVRAPHLSAEQRALMCAALPHDPIYRLLLFNHLAAL